MTKHVWGLCLLLWAASVAAEGEPDGTTVRGGGWAEQTEVEGEGEVPVVGGNLVSARGRALALARQNAVAAAVAKVVPAEKLEQRQTILRGAVYRRDALYVRRYRILEEGEQGRMFRVRVAVELDSKRLFSDLRKLLGEGDVGTTPTTVRAVCLRMDVRPSSIAGVAALMRTRLAAAGFSIPSNASGCGVELVVGLTVREAEGVRGLGLAGAHSRMQLALKNVGAALLLERTQEDWGVAATLEEAQRMAARQTLERATSLVVQALQRHWPRGQGQQVVRVSGVASLRQHQAIQRFMERKVPGVRRVTPRRFERREVWFRVVGGTSRELASLLASHEFRSFIPERPAGARGPEFRSFIPRDTASRSAPSGTRGPAREFKTFRLEVRSEGGGSLWMSVTQ